MKNCLSYKRAHKARETWWWPLESGRMNVKWSAACEVLLCLSQESSCQACSRKKSEIRHLYVHCVHHVCSEEREPYEARQQRWNPARHPTLLPWQPHPDEKQKNNKTSLGKKKKNQCYLPRELKKMHFKEELDISTIWWLFETKVWLQLLQAAEVEHIVLDKLFSLFSSWILNYKWKL